MIAPYSVINSIMEKLCEKRVDSLDSPTWITDAPAVLDLGEDVSNLAPIRAAQRTLLQEIVKYEIQKANGIIPNNRRIIEGAQDLSQAYTDALRKNGTVFELHEKAQAFANNDSNWMEKYFQDNKDALQDAAAELGLAERTSSYVDLLKPPTNKTKTGEVISSR